MNEKFDANKRPGLAPGARTTGIFEFGGRVAPAEFQESILLSPPPFCRGEAKILL
jgi:hypothetical protein